MVHLAAWAMAITNRNITLGGSLLVAYNLKESSTPRVEVTILVLSLKMGTFTRGVEPIVAS